MRQNLKRVEIFTLRPFAVLIGGEPLRLSARAFNKPLQLLKLLAAHGGEAVPVQSLADALWPDADGDSAQHSFSTALYRLRRILGQETLLLSGGRLALSPERCWLDAAEFMRLASALERGAVSQELDQLLELYRAPFLAPEVSPSELIEARERFHAKWLRTITAACERLMASGDPDRAATLTERGLEVDPRAELFYRQLMRIALARGQAGEGIETYERFRRAMDADGGDKPSAETEALRNRLLIARAGRDAHPATRLPVAKRVHSNTVVAISPFVTSSAEPKQRAFADLVAEDLIIGLTRFTEFHVVAVDSPPRTSGTLTAQADYLVEGSVRRENGHARIAVKLKDLRDGSYVWAERLDNGRKPDREQMLQIVGKVAVQLDRAACRRAMRKHPQETEAYEWTLQARPLVHYLNAEAGARARDLLERAVQVDPKFPISHSELSWIYLDEYRHGFNPGPNPLDRSLAAARRAVLLDSESGFAHWRLAKIHYFRKELAPYQSESAKALALNPFHAEILADVGLHTHCLGQHALGAKYARTALVLDPNFPEWNRFTIAGAHYFLGQYQQALDEMLKCQYTDYFWPRAKLALYYSALGRLREARTEAKAALDLRPPANMRGLYEIWNFRPSDIERCLADFRRVGLE